MLIGRCARLTVCQVSSSSKLSLRGESPPQATFGFGVEVEKERSRLMVWRGVCGCYDCGVLPSMFERRLFV
jgi:hypothetical protein